MQDLSDFLSPIDLRQLNDADQFTDGQLGKNIAIFEQHIPDIDEADIVLVGIGERRGSGEQMKENNAADCIRKQLYQLHYWHTDIRIADFGNIKTGATLSDSYAALKTVVSEIVRLNKTIVILGGSHDITLAQYQVYKDLNQIIDVTCVDALIDLRGDSALKSENFLLEMLTGEPNVIHHYNHIGFQSYFVHPRLLETMDKLRFDCYRVGVVKEQIEEMEPVIRHAHFMSFDLNAIKYSDAPSVKCSPNGLSGQEACSLTQYAGMASHLTSLGIYGYDPDTDIGEITAKQIAQMVWYFIDGKSKARKESSLQELDNFNQFHTFFQNYESVFLQSRKTNRWWMQMPDKKYVACSYKDYLSAGNGEIPERWLRTQERN